MRINVNVGFLKQVLYVETALLRLTEDWKASRDNKEIVAVVSMDLSKAFDTIPHALLLAKLKAYGVCDKDCALLRDYLWQTAESEAWGHVFAMGGCQERRTSRECPGAAVFQHLH